jgi:hypothetical protein
MSPLRAGSTQDVISANVEELMGAYHRTGKIGRTTPDDEAHAQRIANAIARKKAGLPTRSEKAKGPKAKLKVSSKKGARW